MKRKLYLVEWVDAHSTRGNWAPLDEIEEMSHPLHVRSVGWVVARRKGMTVVVPHISGEKNDDTMLFVKGELVIPNSNIRKMVRLKEAR